MPAPFNFNGPYLKTERAKYHIDDLKSIFSAHNKANQTALKPRRHGTVWKSAKPIGTPLPKHTPTIMGDALHNLRAALDHAYCILVEVNGCDLTSHPKASRVKFPFTEKGTRQELKGSIDGHAKLGIAPSRAVIDHIFDVIQPYPGGNGDDLLAIHVLDIADKHITILPTEYGTHVDRLETENGIVISGITFMHSAPPGTPITGAAIAFAPGTRLKEGADNKVSLNIGFGRGQPFEGKPVLQTLEGMFERVRKTLSGLESFLPKD